MSVHPEPRQETPRIAATKFAIGAFFVFLGLVLTGENLGLADADRFLRWWPAILIVIGLMQLARDGGKSVGTLLVVIGAWILGYNTGWFPFTIFDLWPLILIFIGMSLVGRAIRGSEASRAGTGDGGKERGLAILSTRRITPTTRPWEGGRAAAILGTCELDLTRVEPADPPPIVDALAIWGAVVVTVPHGWDVIGDVLPIMGGYESKIAPATDARHRVVVRGLALMGGVEVKNAGGRVS